MADISVIKMPNNQSYNLKDAAAREEIENLIAVSTTQPSSEDTKLWINNDASGSVQVPTVSEMNSAIGTAIGNVHQFELSIQQSLPTQDIDTHTIYLIPKTGETNDVYDEYVYINNAWEMIGNTQIDLSNYATKADTVLNTTLSMGRKANTTVGTNSVALGYNVTASGAYSFAEGNGTTASGAYAHSESGGTTASGSCSHAEGGGTTANGNYSHSEGASTTASGESSHAEGSATVASGRNSHAEGTTTVASGDYSHSEGLGGSSYGALGTADHVEGYQCVTLNNVQPGNHAEGYQTQATGGSAHSEGANTTASGSHAHAEGYATTASGTQSHAEGNNTIASGSLSHVSGKYNVEDSYSNWSEWVANTSYAVGDKVKVTNDTTVSGYICKTANSDSTFTLSKWTDQYNQMNYAEIIGNGTANNARSNARVLDWEGNERLKGNIYVGCNADSTGGTMLPYDVQVNGTSVLSQGVANIPKAYDTLGVVKVLSSGSRGIQIGSSSGQLAIFGADAGIIPLGTDSFRPITPIVQHNAVFYGLSKAAGVDLKNETVTLGTYPATSKAAINTLIGSVSKENLDNAGITAKTYTTKFGGEFSVTTADTTGWLKPYARASVTGRISKHYLHRVTINGTTYILQTKLWYFLENSGIKVYEYLGNLNYYVSDTSGVPWDIDNVPFLIISDINNSNSIDILTSTAGTYTILVEQITPTQTLLPKSLIYGDTYVPLDKKNNGGTYNGFNIGVNELKNTRGTFAIGYGNKINNEFSTAIGLLNNISNEWCIALGSGNNLTGFECFALGTNTDVSANDAIAMNYNTIANATNMVAIGKANVAATTPVNWAKNTLYTSGQIVKCLFNGTSTIYLMCISTHTSPDADYFNADDDWQTKWRLAPSNGNTAFAIGNGVNKTKRANAFMVDWAGNTYLNGNLYVNCNSDSTGGTMLPTDIQINSTSIISNGVANIPLADNNTQLGVGRYSNMFGICIETNTASEQYGRVYIYPATDTDLVSTTSTGRLYRPIVPQNMHKAIFYGLAKAAEDTTQASSSNAIGTYTDDAKTAIQTMLGAQAAIEVIRL